MSGRRTARLILLLLVLVLVPSIRMKAQFKEEAFSQSYNSDADSLGRDTSDVMFSFKDYFRSISHKKEGKIGTVFAGSTIFIGGQQIYNRDYWKLPVIYGGIAAGAGTGILMRSKFNSTGENRYKKISTWCFAGAGLIYWGALMDGVVNYKSDVEHLPGRATLYAVLVPGLGQVYNGEYWKIPIYYGLMAGSAHFLALNNKNYHRYKKIHNDATTEGSGYDGPVSASSALYYRDIFRRYRDYSIVALAASYLLQIIDANVFSYMQEFEMDDNLTLKVTPTVITPDSALAFNSAGAGFGMRIGLTF